ncbi:MAG TPA: hydantoinase/oxoprolinase family protein [Dehalococcoidales bacterium]|nr:hydantoinase/oxoprolinase family protein [Dehalococcoidales bacterium]
MAFRVGIDVGGTFTDAIAVDDKGFTQTGKAPTTPRDLTVGTMNVIDILAGRNNLDRRQFLSRVSTIVHGTTTGTNIIATRVGPKMGLLCTRGHRDVIQFRRVAKDNMYDWRVDFPEVLVPRYLRVEIGERIDARGNVRVPLDEASVRKAVAYLKKLKVESIIVALLFSFLYPSHERRAAEIVRQEYPEADVTISSDVLPAVGEYERTSTAIINAFIAPAIHKYTKKITGLLEQEGFKGQFLYIQNNGGVETAEIAMEKPATLAMSGPAAGPSAAITIGKLHGVENLLSIDMGGTSLDLGIIDKGTSLIKTESLIEEHRFSLPVIDVTSIGAGGGSVAWFDVTNTLRVGPRSAGADPGPACYGTGGEEATVTDADVILGYISPDYFLGGEMKLQRNLAEKALKERVADRLGVSVLEAAAAVYKVINSVMANTVSYTITRRGLDPRDFYLCIGGAAGAVHAVQIARELCIDRVFIPKYAPIYCAFGMLGVNLKHDYSRFYSAPVQALDLERVKQLYQDMAREGLTVLSKEEIPEEQRELVGMMTVKYYGQYRGIDVEWPSRTITMETISEGLAAFHRKHKDLYGYADEKYPLEIMGFGLTAIGKLPPITLKKIKTGSRDAGQALKGVRDAYFDESGGYTETRIYDGDKMLAGNILEGPCVVEERMTNVVIPPGYRMQVDEYGNYVTLT